jgi:hypothetical protein
MRALCWIIGHHKWPKDDLYYEGPCLRCGKGERRSKWSRRWQQWYPLHLRHYRWGLELRIGWLYRLSLSLTAQIEALMERRVPYITARLNTKPAELGISLGGFWQSEDGDGDRALFRLWLDISDPIEPGKRLLCRWRGHKPGRLYETGNQYCERCSEAIKP